MKYFAILASFTFLLAASTSLAHEPMDQLDMHDDEEKEVTQVSPAVLMIGLVGVGGIGALVWYFMKKGKTSKTPPASSDPSATKNSNPSQKN